MGDGYPYDHSIPFREEKKQYKAPEETRWTTTRLEGRLYHVSYLSRCRCEIISKHPLASIEIASPFVRRWQGRFVKEALTAVCHAFPARIRSYEGHDQHRKAKPEENKPIAAEQ